LVSARCLQFNQFDNNSTASGTKKVESAAPPKVDENPPKIDEPAPVAPLENPATTAGDAPEATSAPAAAPAPAEEQPKAEVPPAAPVVAAAA